MVSDYLHACVNYDRDRGYQGQDVNILLQSFADAARGGIFCGLVIAGRFCIVHFAAAAINILPVKATSNDTQTGVTCKDWGNVNGRLVQLYTLTNASGMTAEITNYGAAIVSWMAPDRHGNRSSVIVGLETLEEYIAQPFYLGAIIGRFANRIAGGRFELDGKEYLLPQNNSGNTLHGGPEGFHRKVWEAKIIPSMAAIELSLVSANGDEGFPGTLRVHVRYEITNDGSLRIDYSAETDAATPVNLTNHSYFNLAGDTAVNVQDHLLQIHAECYTPANEALIPDGSVATVHETALDFTMPKAIGAGLETTRGYDHNFVLDKQDNMLPLVATVTEHNSGRKIEVFTTQPGLQLYTGGFLDGSFKARGTGNFIAKNTAFCLETQHFPDSPNQPKFPDTILRPGEIYRHTTMYRLSLML